MHTERFQISPRPQCIALAQRLNKTYPTYYIQLSSAYLLPLTLAVIRCNIHCISLIQANYTNRTHNKHTANYTSLYSHIKHSQYIHSHSTNKHSV